MILQRLWWMWFFSVDGGKKFYLQSRYRNVCNGRAKWEVEDFSWSSKQHRFLNVHNMFWVRDGNCTCDRWKSFLLYLHFWIHNFIIYFPFQIHKTASTNHQLAIVMRAFEFVHKLDHRISRPTAAHTLKYTKKERVVCIKVKNNNFTPRFAAVRGCIDICDCSQGLIYMRDILQQASLFFFSNLQNAIKHVACFSYKVS